MTPEEIIEFLQEEPHLLELLQEIKIALQYSKADEKNTMLRKEVIYKQFADKLLTDQERAAYYGLPEGCRMREGAKIICPETLECGENVYISENALLDASGGLKIGAHTTVGVSVCLWSHTSAWANIAKANYPQNSLITRTATVIGEGTFIGAHCVIGPGVQIGNQVIMLPLSYANQDILNDRVIIRGNPAQILSNIREEKIHRLLNQISRT